MFKLDDNLLIELGLGSLPPVEKNRMLSYIYETLELRVGMKLAQKMTNEQLLEFEAFIDRSDEAGALKWLETNFPDYKQVVANELETLKGEIKTAAPQIVASSQQSAAMPSPQSVQQQPQQYQQPQLPQQPQQSSVAPQYPAQAPQQPVPPVQYSQGAAPNGMPVQSPAPPSYPAQQPYVGAQPAPVQSHQQQSAAMPSPQSVQQQPQQYQQPQLPQQPQQSSVAPQYPAPPSFAVQPQVGQVDELLDSTAPTASLASDQQPQQ